MIFAYGVYAGEYYNFKIEQWKKVLNAQGEMQRVVWETPFIGTTLKDPKPDADYKYDPSLYASTYLALPEKNDLPSLFKLNGWLCFADFKIFSQPKMYFESIEMECFPPESPFKMSVGVMCGTQNGVEQSDQIEDFHLDFRPPVGAERKMINKILMPKFRLSCSRKK